MFKSDRLRARRRFAVDQRQMNGTGGIGMSDRRAYAGIHNLKRDLLAAFASKRLTGRFARLDLTADELPSVHQATSRLAVAREDTCLLGG